ncbi:MAG: hypothetical protein FJZ01_13450 [Candidatus Sericytochromatia bacterium]|nr:hypothetical protein [Candidatus Tanganyikabacteria bacterium]
MLQSGDGVGAEVSFSPRWWAFIGSTRIFVRSFCGEIFDQDMSSRIAMAAHELLENAAKYSRSPDSPITCSFRVDDACVRVMVTNHPLPEHIPALAEELASVNAGDAFETYVRKMEESLQSDRSRLGLARIRCLGGARLDLTIEGGQVELTATFDRPV